VFRRIVDGEEVEKVVADYNSRSKVYKGLQMYLNWARPKADQVQKTIDSRRIEDGKLQEEINALQGQREILNGKIKQFTNEKTGLSSEVDKTRGQLEDLRKAVAQENAEFTGLQSKIKELQGRGYTDEIVSKLSSSDAAHEREMFSRVQTLEKYQAEVDSHNKTLGGLVKDLEASKKELKQLVEKSKQTKEEVAKCEATLLRRQDDQRVFEKMVKECANVLEDIRKTNKESQKLFSDKMKEYEEMQNEAGKYGADIERAIAFLDLEANEAALRKMGKDTAELLLLRLKQWVELQHWKTKKDRTYGMMKTDYGEDLNKELDYALTLLRDGELAR
jgi:chromosome segregation ATPase